jgi:hypothetical protein
MSSYNNLKDMEVLHLQLSIYKKTLPMVKSPYVEHIKDKINEIEEEIKKIDTLDLKQVEELKVNIRNGILKKIRDNDGCSGSMDSIKNIKNKNCSSYTSQKAILEILFEIGELSICVSNKKINDILGKFYIQLKIYGKDMLKNVLNIDIEQELYQTYEQIEAWKLIYYFNTKLLQL